MKIGDTVHIHKEYLSSLKFIKVTTFIPNIWIIEDIIEIDLGEIFFLLKNKITNFLSKSYVPHHMIISEIDYRNEKINTILDDN